MQVRIVYLILLLNLPFVLNAQRTDANIFGDVKSEGKHIPFATVFLEGTSRGTVTDETGHYMFIDLPVGRYTITAKSVGYKPASRVVDIQADKTLEINFVLEQEVMPLDEVVVTGTRTFKRLTDSPVIVNIIDSRSIQAVQACNLSEGLRFQPGLRVETDCQTCNYTQLRMNGLGGGYSQILINGRPVFSPLVGLYGLEQIPSNMVERIEVVRGGGSALYGSSAIGGTVNVITRMPQSNQYDLSLTGQSTGGETADLLLNGNLSMLTNKRNAGAVLFVNQRMSQAYDHPGLSLMPDGSYIREKDGFSDLPELRNNSFGGNFIFKPTPNSKLEMSFSSLYEYRYGGEMNAGKAHMAAQSEERTHNIMMAGADYQLDFNKDRSSFILYLAGQHTGRDHYTGLLPVLDDFDNDSAYNAGLTRHLAEPPYGTTSNTTLQTGTQFNHRVEKFLIGSNLFTFGMDVLSDNIIDSIPAYQYGTNQETLNVAGFLQSDWKLNNSFTLLTGLRADKHNLLDKPVLSPRASLLYRFKDYTQLRLSWGTGFRAPQAFDTDMHIAFAAGGISRISLAPDLGEERSNSISGSLNFDRPARNYIYGLTLEAFHTRLDHAFYLQPIGEDDRGILYEKRNGPGARVQGITAELRGNYNKKAQLETGITLQTSRHQEAVENLEGLPPRKEFLRSPNHYAYAIASFNPGERFSASLSSIYTGSMLLVKYSPDKSVIPDEYRRSPSFAEFSLRLAYTFLIPGLDSGLEFYGGVKNIGNAWQSDQDNGRNRDSNYVYGPAQPRSFYLGLRVKSM